MSKENIKRYTVGEEVFNSVSHGVAALLSVIGTTVMLTLSTIYGDVSAILSSIIYGISLILLYTMSTLYHAFPFDKVKRIFRVFDHSSIPVLIAGSYTPFCLIALKSNTQALITIIAIWIICSVCILLNVINLQKYEKIALVLYIIMGWSVILLIGDIITALPTQGFYLLLAGGLSYTIGIIFYKIKKIKYMHSVWHLFVVLGSVLHYLCVVIYVLPMTY